MTPAQAAAHYLTQTLGPHPAEAIEQLWGHPITRCPPDRTSHISIADLCARILAHDSEPASCSETGQAMPDHPQARAFNGQTIIALLPLPNGRPHPHWTHHILPGRTTIAQLRRRGISRHVLARAARRGWLCLAPGEPR